MSYASLSKGAIALMTGLTTTKKFGVYDAILNEFKDSQIFYYDSMINGIPNVTHKAYGWIGDE